MLKVGFQSKSNAYFNNKNKPVVSNIKTTDNSSVAPQCSKPLSFKSNLIAANFVVLNRTVTTFHNAEFKHIADVLKTLGIKELTLGDNIDLARLLKRATQRVKRLGYDVPTKTICESEFFNTNEYVRKESARATARLSGGKYTEGVTTGSVYWRIAGEPVMYLNTKADWLKENASTTKVLDKRHVIWHEVGHWLHMKRHTFRSFASLSKVELNPYEREIMKQTIGDYGAEVGVPDAIAEIFARLVSGESYDKLHPEIFNIYNKYNGPMPNMAKR